MLLYIREAVGFLKYMVIKGFMDVDGFKKEGSIIEVDDHRAAKLRRYGLIAGSAKESASIRSQENAKAPGVDVKESLPTEEVEDIADMQESEDIEVTSSEGENRRNLKLDHMGGGFYLLPDGSKVKGKVRAIEALKESWCP